MPGRHPGMGYHGNGNYDNEELFLKVGSQPWAHDAGQTDLMALGPMGPLHAPSKHGVKLRCTTSYTVPLVHSHQHAMAWFECSPQLVGMNRQSPSSSPCYGFLHSRGGSALASLTVPRLVLSCPVDYCRGWGRAGPTDRLGSLPGAWARREQLGACKSAALPRVSPQSWRAPVLSGVQVHSAASVSAACSVQSGRPALEGERPGRGGGLSGWQADGVCAPRDPRASGGTSAPRAVSALLPQAVQGLGQGWTDRQAGLPSQGLGRAGFCRPGHDDEMRVESDKGPGAEGTGVSPWLLFSSLSLRILISKIP